MSKTGMAGDWDVRRASLHDAEALTALCTAAVGPDDYVIRFLEDMILHGVLHVALDGDRIVGMAHYAETIDHSAWLGAARTHPGYRRKGVAMALMRSFAGLASRSRVPALRLWSSARNTAGNESARAGGFREVARFTRVRRKAAKGTARAAPLSFDPALVEEAARSPLLGRANGFVPYRGYFVPLSPANLHLLASAGAFHRVASGLVALSVHRYAELMGTKAVELGLVAGDAEKILEAMPAAAGALGYREVHSFLPHDAKILGAAHEAGYENEEWGQEAVLFERAVALGPASYRKRPTYAEIAAGKRTGYAAMALLAPRHEHGHTGPHEDRWNR